MRSAAIGTDHEVTRSGADVLTTSRLISEECYWLSPGAVRMLVMRRKIPFRKVNGRVLFLRREIRRWIESAPGMRPEEIEK